MMCRLEVFNPHNTPRLHFELKFQQSKRVADMKIMKFSNLYSSESDDAGCRLITKILYPILVCSQFTFEN